MNTNYSFIRWFKLSQLSEMPIEFWDSSLRWKFETDVLSRGSTHLQGSRKQGKLMKKPQKIVWKDVDGNRYLLKSLKRDEVKWVIKIIE